MSRASQYRAEKRPVSKRPKGESKHGKKSRSLAHAEPRAFLKRVRDKFDPTVDIVDSPVARVVRARKYWEVERKQAPKAKFGDHKIIVISANCEIVRKDKVTGEGKTRTVIVDLTFSLTGEELPDSLLAVCRDGDLRAWKPNSMKRVAPAEGIAAPDLSIGLTMSPESVSSHSVIPLRSGPSIAAGL